MQFVDKALARRFESCEEMPQVLYARVFQKTRPQIGAVEQEICGGHMVFAGLGSPIGRATGVGLDRPFTAQDLDQVEEFYRSCGAPAQVDLCPLHDSSVFEMFKERGYGIAELNNVLYRRLEAKEEFAVRSRRLRNTAWTLWKRPRNWVASSNVRFSPMVRPKLSKVCFRRSIRWMAP